VKAEDIDVSLEGDVLTIKGIRKEESEVKEEDYYRAERSFGEFRRSIRVPEGTKPEDIKATFKDGVLEVTAPKPKEAERESKKVKVEVQ
jgi:HSP20 family protein